MTMQFLRGSRNATVSRPLARLAVITLVAVLATGCAATQTMSHGSRLETTVEKPRILLMTPDVKYYLLTAGGLTEPHADWTTSAQHNFVTAVQTYAEERGSNLIVMDYSQPLGELETRYDRLHGAVGMVKSGDELYVIMYLAADPHYFDKSLSDATSQIQSARLRT